MKDIKWLEQGFENIDKLFDYVADKYGEKEASFVCERLAPVAGDKTLDSMKLLAEKFAIFNGWKAK